MILLTLYIFAGSVVACIWLVDTADYETDIGLTWGSMAKIAALWPLFLFIKPRLLPPGE